VGWGVGGGGPLRRRGVGSENIQKERGGEEKTFGTASSVEQSSVLPLGLETSLLGQEQMGGGVRFPPSVQLWRARVQLDSSQPRCTCAQASLSPTGGATIREAATRVSKSLKSRCACAQASLSLTRGAVFREAAARVSKRSKGCCQPGVWMWEWKFHTKQARRARAGESEHWVHYQRRQESCRVWIRRVGPFHIHRYGCSSGSSLQCFGDLSSLGGVVSFVQARAEDKNVV